MKLTFMAILATIAAMILILVVYTTITEKEGEQ